MSAKHERAFEELASTLRKFGWPIDDEDNPAEMRRALDAYLRVMREPGPDEVRVRACVAVNTWADGGDGYNAAGWSGANDVANKRMARDCRCGDQPEPQYRWIEANVRAWAKPDEPTVEGEVAP